MLKIRPSNRFKRDLKLIAERDLDLSLLDVIVNNLDPFYSEANISYLKGLTAEIDTGNAVPAEHGLKED